MSDTNPSFTLIEGTFDSEEAREILMSLIGRKIEFHHKKNLRHQERKGVAHQNSLNRIEELKKTRKEILAHLKEMKRKQISVFIKSDVFYSATENHHSGGQQ
jgi:hypothetical protein